MTPIEFFYQHVGYSYTPGRETPSQGRRRCARALASAERKATREGLSFEWRIDEGATSADFDDGPDVWALWECWCRDMDGEIVATLGAIDFGPDGEPWGAYYRRVVEAELAQEALHASEPHRA